MSDQVAASASVFRRKSPCSEILRRTEGLAAITRHSGQPLTARCVPGRRCASSSASGSFRLPPDCVRTWAGRSNCCRHRRIPTSRPRPAIASGGSRPKKTGLSADLFSVCSGGAKTVFSAKTRTRPVAFVPAARRRCCSRWKYSSPAARVQPVKSSVGQRPRSSPEYAGQARVRWRRGWNSPITRFRAVRSPLNAVFAGPQEAVADSPQTSAAPAAGGRRMRTTRNGSSLR